MSTLVAVVTGASSGIGLQTALALCLDQNDTYSKVIFAVRNPPKIQHIVNNIPNAEIIALDLASLASVERFVQLLEDSGIPRIDRLVLNAGIKDYTIPGVSKTIDGMDEIWQVNFVAHFYLFNLLRRNRLSCNARVICLSSVMHWFGNPGRFVDIINTASVRNSLNHYADSKLAMAIFASEISKRNSNVQSVAVNPGSVATDIFRAWFAVGFLGMCLRILFGTILLTSKEGAKASLYACSPSFTSCKFQYISPYGQIKGRGRFLAFLSDVYWFWVARNPENMIGECASAVTDKMNGESLWALATEAISRTNRSVGY